MPNTSSTQSKHPTPKWYFSPFLYPGFPWLSLTWFHMNEPMTWFHSSVVNRFTARFVGTIKVVSLKGPRRGWWNMTSWWLVGWDLGSCWLDNTISMWWWLIHWYNPKRIVVSNWKASPSQGFWLIQTERIFGSTLFFAENDNIHRNVGVFTSSSISMSELSERCFVQQRMAAKESSGDHQKLSRVEPGASTYTSICCF